MKRASHMTAGQENAVTRRSAQRGRARSACARLMLAAFLAAIAGCSNVGTVVKSVTQDSNRPSSAVLGKTLVVALLEDPGLAVALEEEWALQLRDRGIEAYPLSAVLPGQRPPQEQAVIERLKKDGFATLLVSRVVGVKQVEREVVAHQVGVVETRLYDAATGEPFWSARSDTYLENRTGERVRDPRGELVGEFVQVLAGAMAKSGLL